MREMLGIDWQTAWKERNEKRTQPGDCSYWDDRAKDFKEHSGVSRYADVFLEYLELEPSWSVLDMGSGPGTIARPLAKAGHEVIAADFSPGMLNAALERAAQDGIENFQVKQLDWDEDWEAAGILPKSVDVVIASRSTIVDDLAAALRKLDRTARHKVAITLTTEYSPRGYKPRGSKQEGMDEYLADYIYCLNMLFQMGVYPELRYIDTTHGNGGEMEDQLVRWAYISWKPL